MRDVQYISLGDSSIGQCHAWPPHGHPGWPWSQSVALWALLTSHQEASGWVFCQWPLVAVSGVGWLSSSVRGTSGKGHPRTGRSLGPPALWLPLESLHFPVRSSFPCSQFRGWRQGERRNWPRQLPYCPFNSEIPLSLSFGESKIQN